MRWIGIFYKVLNYPNDLLYKMRKYLQKKMLHKCGRNIRIGRNVEITWKNCSIGDDVYIGDNATFLCASASLKIGLSKKRWWR